MVVVFLAGAPVCHQAGIFLFQAGSFISGGRSDIPKDFLEMICTEPLVPDW